jgi:hypothetical protein
MAAVPLARCTASLFLWFPFQAEPLECARPADLVLVLGGLLSLVDYDDLNRPFVSLQFQTELIL